MEVMKTLLTKIGTGVLLVASAALGIEGAKRNNDLMLYGGIISAFVIPLVSVIYHSRYQYNQDKKENEKNK